MNPRRIRVNGVLYERVMDEKCHRRGTRRKVNEAKARPFDRDDYRTFDAYDLPDGSNPLVYYRPVDWVVGNDAAALALSGTGHVPDEDDIELGFEDDEPTVVIALQWLEDDDCSATLEFTDQDEAERTFDRMLRDVDSMKPRDLAKKYHMDIY